MITTNSSGNALVASYGDYIKEDARALEATLYLNGNVLTGELDEFKIVKGSCGTLTDFTVGNIVSSQFTATIEDLEDAVKGETIEVRIGLELPDESYEWVTLGFFIINDVRTVEDVSVITGHGVLTSASGSAFTEPATKTLANIATNIGTGLGCTVTLDASIDDTLEVDGAMNGITVYQALQILTTLVGGYAVETNDGNVKICVYDDTPTLTVSTDITETPRVEADDFAITGVRCRVSEASSSSSGSIPAVEYSQGTVNLDMTSRYMTQDIFDDMYPHVIGYTYRPASVVMLLGDPRLEGNDVIQLEHYDEDTETTVTYVVPCHKLTHYYDGGLFSVIQAVKATDIDTDIGTMSPFQTAISQINSEVIGARYDAENAVQIATDTAQYFWVSSDGADNGAHVTQIPAEDFIADPDAGGGNTLITTNGMAVRDGLEELAVFSGSEVRVGRIDDAKTVIQDGTVMLLTPDGVPAFSVNSGTGSGSQTIKKIIGTSFLFNVNKSDLPVTITRQYADMTDVGNGDSFSLVLQTNGENRSEIQLQKGTASSETLYLSYGAHNAWELSVDYDGSTTVDYTLVDETYTTPRLLVGEIYIQYTSTVANAQVLLSTNSALTSKINGLSWSNVMVDGNIELKALILKLLSNLKDFFMVSTETFSYPAISSGSGSGTRTATFSPAYAQGYYPLGVVGFRTGNSSAVAVRFDLSSRSSGTAELSYVLRAVGSVSAGSGDVHILWVKE